MSKKRFRVRLEAEVVIELDEKVLLAVDAEWRSQFYALFSDDTIAEHIAYNLVVNRAKLSYLDGWADQSDSNACIVEQPDWEVYFVEEEK